MAQNPVNPLEGLNAVEIQSILNNALQQWSPGGSSGAASNPAMLRQGYSQTAFFASSTSSLNSDVMSGIRELIDQLRKSNFTVSTPSGPTSRSFSGLGSESQDFIIKQGIEQVLSKFHGLIPEKALDKVRENASRLATIFADMSRVGGNAPAANYAIAQQTFLRSSVMDMSDRDQMNLSAFVKRLLMSGAINPQEFQGTVNKVLTNFARENYGGSISGRRFVREGYAATTREAIGGSADTEANQLVVSQISRGIREGLTLNRQEQFVKSQGPLFNILSGIGSSEFGPEQGGGRKAIMAGIVMARDQMRRANAEIESARKEIRSIGDIDENDPNAAEKTQRRGELTQKIQAAEDKKASLEEPIRKGMEALLKPIRESFNAAGQGFKNALSSAVQGITTLTEIFSSQLRQLATATLNPVVVDLVDSLKFGLDVGLKAGQIIATLTSGILTGLQNLLSGVLQSILSFFGLRTILNPAKLPKNTPSGPFAGGGWAGLKNSAAQARASLFGTKAPVEVSAGAAVPKNLQVAADKADDAAKAISTAATAASTTAKTTGVNTGPGSPLRALLNASERQEYRKALEAAPGASKRMRRAAAQQIINRRAPAAAAPTPVPTAAKTAVGTGTAVPTTAAATATPRAGITVKGLFDATKSIATTQLPNLAKGGLFSGLISGGLTGYEKYKQTGDLGKAVAAGVSNGIGTAVGTAIGSALGGAIGSIFGPIGTFLGSLAGGYIGGSLGGKAGNWFYDTFLGGKAEREAAEKAAEEEAAKQKEIDDYNNSAYGAGAIPILGIKPSDITADNIGKLLKGATDAAGVTATASIGLGAVGAKGAASVATGLTAAIFGVGGGALVGGGLAVVDFFLKQLNRGAEQLGKFATISNGINIGMNAQLREMGNLGGRGDRGKLTEADLARAFRMTSARLNRIGYTREDIGKLYATASRTSLMDTSQTIKAIDSAGLVAKQLGVEATELMQSFSSADQLSGVGRGRETYLRTLYAVNARNSDGNVTGFTKSVTDSFINASKQLQMANTQTVSSGTDYAASFAGLYNAITTYARPDFGEFVKLNPEFVSTITNSIGGFLKGAVTGSNPLALAVGAQAGLSMRQMREMDIARDPKSLESVVGVLSSYLVPAGGMSGGRVTSYAKENILPVLLENLGLEGSSEAWSNIIELARSGKISEAQEKVKELKPENKIEEAVINIDKNLTEGFNRFLDVSETGQQRNLELMEKNIDGLITISMAADNVASDLLSMGQNFIDPAVATVSSVLETLKIVVQEANSILNKAAEAKGRSQEGILARLAPYGIKEEDIKSEEGLKKTAAAQLNSIGTDFLLKYKPQAIQALEKEFAEVDFSQFGATNLTSFLGQTGGVVSFVEEFLPDVKSMERLYSVLSSGKPIDDAGSQSAIKSFAQNVFGDNEQAYNAFVNLYKRGGGNPKLEEAFAGSGISFDTWLYDENSSESKINDKTLTSKLIEVFGKEGAKTLIALEALYGAREEVQGQTKGTGAANYIGYLSGNQQVMSALKNGDSIFIARTVEFIDPKTFEPIKSGTPK